MPSSNKQVNLLHLAASTLASTIVAARKIKNLSEIEPTEETDDDSNRTSDGNSNSNSNSNNNDVSASNDSQPQTATDRKNTRLKDDGSFVTDADIASQGIIVQAIRRISTEVRIVGEESDEDMREAQDLISKEDDFDEHTYQLALDEITIRYNRSSTSKLPLSQRNLNAEIEPTKAGEKADIDSENRPANSVQIGDDCGDNDAQASDSASPVAMHHEQNGDGAHIVTATTTAAAPPTPLHDEQSDVNPSQLPEGESSVDAAAGANIDIDVNVDVNRVCVFIDPLDGTKAYARGDYDIVSILIAVILDQRPCFGIICKPFGYRGTKPILDTGCVCFYGGTLLKGVYTAGSTKQTVPDASAVDAPKILPRAVISSSRSAGVVQAFCSYLGEKGVINPEPLLVGGAGEKSLRIILRSEQEGLWFFPRPGTSLWDVAASDALLRASGGKLTDSLGNDMDYSKLRTDAENNEGVIACFDEGMHSECLELFHGGGWTEQRT